MSDYLTQIAARSLNLANTVQPRVSSRFEPLAGIADHLVPQPDLFEVEQVIERDLPPVPSRMWRSSPSEASVSDSAIQRNVSVPVVAVRRNLQEAAENPAAPDRAMTHSPPAQPQGPRPMAKQETSRPSTTAEASAAEKSGQDDRPSVERPESLPVAEPRQSTPQILKVVERFSTVATADHQAMTPREGMPERPIPLKSVSPVAPLAIAPAPSGERSAAAEPVNESARSIQVTIGRIDVRAIMPATAPPVAPPAKTRIQSLDDYLRERSGGPK